MQKEEIRMLKKDGQFAKALELARKEYASFPTNENAGILFSVLFEYCKDRLAKKDEKRARALYEQVVELMKDIPQEHRVTWKNYAYLCKKFSEPESLYRALKDHLLEMDADQAQETLLGCIDSGVDKPSLLYSLMLGAAISANYRFPSINLADFCRRWGMENLTERDILTTITPQGEEYPSLAERLGKRLFDTEDDPKVVFELFRSTPYPQQKVSDIGQERWFLKIKKAPQKSLPGMFLKYASSFRGMPPTFFHSDIMDLFIRTQRQDTPEEASLTLSFMRDWGLENLSSYDWNSHGRAPHRTPALAERCAITIGRALAHCPAKDSEEFLPFLRKASERIDSQQIRRELAMALSRAGLSEEALSTYKGILSSGGGDGRTWYGAGLLVGDAPTRAGYFSHALMVEKNPRNIEKMHLSLAQTLSEMEEPEAALDELISYRASRDSEGLEISPLYEDILSRISHLHQGHSQENLSSPDDPLLGCREKAYESIYGEIKETEMTVESRFLRQGDGKERISLKDSESGKVIKVSPKVNPVLGKAAKGDVLMVKMVSWSDEHLRIVSVRATGRNIIEERERQGPAQMEIPPGGKEVSGWLRLRTNSDGTAFGFVSGCYVPGKTLSGSGISEECFVKGVAVPSNSGKGDGLKVVWMTKMQIP